MIAIFFAELGSSVVTDRGALRHVVSHHAEHALEALVGQLRVGRRRRNLSNTSLVVDRRCRDRGAGVQVTDDADNLGSPSASELLRGLLAVSGVIFGQRVRTWPSCSSTMMPLALASSTASLAPFSLSLPRWAIWPDVGPT